MIRLYVVSVLFLSMNSFAQSVDIDKIKMVNERITSECVDFKKMSKEDLHQSLKLTENLAEYIKKNPATADEQKKGIDVGVKAIGVNKKNVVVVMTKKSNLATEPGHSLRSETREILQKRLNKWHVSQPKDQKNLIVRFDDECYVPNRCMDYQYGHSLRGKLNRLGCK